jgi:ArsR family transcriptional regulator, lead/cadmium/zinc/bismuth-responsive transcriptional repressor
MPSAASAPRPTPAQPTPAQPTDVERVRRARASVLGAGDAQRLATLLTLLSEPTRSRALFALVAVDEICVGDLAIALGVNEDQASYALRQLRSAGLVESRRHGRVVYSRLAEGFPHPLLEHCLRQLLTITAGSR